MKKNNSYILILLIFPYLYLFPHTFQFIEMGNDFELLYYSYKKYIFEFINVGHLPLWSPSESLGYSLIFNPFAQYFYPLSWILYSIAYLVGDLSKHLFLLYTIFGISIFSIGQYCWLKELKIDIKYCFISTLIICIGLKINEILRFPNAMHAFCWFPWILYGMTIALEKKKIFKPFIIIFFSTLCILTAGYPYYILYGLVLFFLYFVFISFPSVKILIFEKNKIDNYFKFFLKLSVPPILALIIISPWFLGIQEIMEITRDRNLNEINFSRIIGSDLLDHIGSWIFPPMSQAETNYYPGAIVILILLIYLICFLKKTKRVKFEIYFIIFFLLSYFFIFQISNSQHSLIFEFIWNEIDFIKNFRAFGRINILLIPLFAVLICYSLKNITEIIGKSYLTKLAIILGLIIIFSQIYVIEYLNLTSAYWDTWQAKRLGVAADTAGTFGIIFELYNSYIYSIFTLLSVTVLIFVSKYNYPKYLVKIIIILSIAELFILSNIQWAIPHKYYDHNGYNKISVTPLKDLQNSFETNRVSTTVKGNTYYRNDKKFNINYFDQFGIDQHTQYFDLYFTRKGNYRKTVSQDLQKKINFFWSLEKNNHKVFFSNSIDYKNIEEFLNDVYKNEDNFNNKIFIDTKNYNGDRLLIRYNPVKSGYISFIDNWSPGWKVYVNNKKVNINVLLGSYKSVQINKGYNEIVFKYEPW